MRSRSLPRASLILLSVLSLVLASYIQIGPLATSAEAFPPYACTPERDGWEYAEEIGNGIYLIWHCKHVPGFGWTWWPIGIEYGNLLRSRQRTTRFVNSALAVQNLTHSVLGDGSGGGFGYCGIELRSGSGSPMSRPLQCRIIMRYQPRGSSSWYTCHDSNWHQSASATSKYQYKMPQYTEPDCGDAYYEVRAGGRYWSNTYNRWVFPGWVFSGALWLDGPGCCVTPTEPPTQDTEVIPE
jgi:hypothetical protein